MAGRTLEEEHEEEVGRRWRTRYRISEALYAKGQPKTRCHREIHGRNDVKRKTIIQEEAASNRVYAFLDSSWSLTSKVET